MKAVLQLECVKYFTAQPKNIGKIEDTKICGD